MIYSNTHLSEASNIIKKIDTKKIENMVDIILNEGEYNEYGDINGDGYLNILDILILVEVILTQP